MVLFYVVFFWILLIAEHVVRMPDLHIFKSEARASVPMQPQHGCHAIIADDGRDDAPAINRAVAAHKGPGPLVITLPEGILDIITPVVINRSNVTVQGAGLDPSAGKPCKPDSSRHKGFRLNGSERQS